MNSATSSDSASSLYPEPGDPTMPVPGHAAIRLVALLVCLLSPQIATAQPPTSASAERDANLLVGYSLLDSTLSGEGMLKWLLLARKVTFQSPAKATQDLLTEISETSAARSKQLERLRKLNPPATGTPPPSPIGDAIQTAATEAGTHEMLFPDGAFDIRFLFLQAQATRMASVIAAQTAKIDPNPERKAWLNEVSKQYEGFRDELVTSLSACTPKD